MRLPRTTTNCGTEHPTTEFNNITCGPRALCGWSPPSLPADTNIKRRVDRYVIAGLPALGALALVIGLLNLAPHVAVGASLAIDGAAAVIAGGWCMLNFWRCRHAHCLVTGVGWLSLAVLAFIESGIGRSVIHGEEAPAFFAVFGVALLFECGWSLHRRTNALSGPFAQPVSTKQVPRSPESDPSPPRASTDDANLPTLRATGPIAPPASPRR